MQNNTDYTKLVEKNYIIKNPEYILYKPGYFDKLLTFIYGPAGYLKTYEVLEIDNQTFLKLRI